MVGFERFSFVVGRTCRAKEGASDVLSDVQAQRDRWPHGERGCAR
jgi:hypothetical protein